MPDLELAARELLALWDAGEDAGGEHDLDQLARRMEELRMSLGPGPRSDGNGQT